MSLVVSAVDIMHACMHACVCVCKQVRMYLLIARQGGGRLARERLGIYTPRKWEYKMQASAGIAKDSRRLSPAAVKSRGGRGADVASSGMRGSKLSKEESEKLKQKRKSYLDLIKRSKKMRVDRKQVKMNADALREELDEEFRAIRFAFKNEWND